MKSFAVKQDANDPRWFRVFIPWFTKASQFDFNGESTGFYYGLEKSGRWFYSESRKDFDRILTLDEWEREFINPQPQLAGREYDEGLLRFWNEYDANVDNATVKDFLNQRYAKTDRISEIKAEIERLKKELKEIEI